MTSHIAKRRVPGGLFLSALLTALSLAPSTALATPIVGYSLQISEGVISGGNSLIQSAQLLAARDCPLFTLTNTSSDAKITQFSVTIGDTNYHFDAVTFNAQPGGPQVTNFGPDSVQGGAIADVATLNFSNFTPGSSFKFRTDIDPDNGNFLTNFRQVLAGAVPAKITVAFSDGSVLYDELATLANTGFVGSIYRCAYLTQLPPIPSSQQQTGVVPEPSGLLLALLGVIGTACFGRWSRRLARRSTSC